MPVIGRYPHTTSSNWLGRHLRNVASQCGEDGVLQTIFEILPAAGARWCVEFGAWDGKHHSNTWNLMTDPVWHGVLIEASAKRFAELQETYRGNPRASCLNCLVQFDGPDMLDGILGQTAVPADFDLMSIDVDGNDYSIWDSVSRFRPKVVVIEINPTIPNDVAFVQERNMQVHQGNSLLAMVMLGKEKGYELIATTVLNAVFVLKDYFPLFKITDNDIYKMYNPGANETKLFQLYDGSLVLEGCQKLLWHGSIALRAEAIQVLPPELRNFPDRPT